MNTENPTHPTELDILARMQSETHQRLELELNELRTAMMAMATSCEQSLTRLRGTRWIAIDDASRAVAEYSEAAETERSRAAQLTGDLETAKHQLDEVRAASRTEVEAAKRELDEVHATSRTQLEAAKHELDVVRAASRTELEAARRELDEVHAASRTELDAAKRELDEVHTAYRTQIEAARNEIDEVRTQCDVQIAIARETVNRSRDDRATATSRELNAVRELAAAAMEAEAKAREQLAAMQTRNQEIADAQMLRLVELKRELERVSAEADRAREAAERANREASERVAREASARLTQQRVPVKQVVAEAPQQRPVEAKPNHITPSFDAIEAVLAGSPPVAAWERTA